MIKIVGESKYIDKTNAFVGIGDKRFRLQAGPTVYPDKKVFLQVDLKNNLTTDVSLYPTVKIWQRSVTGALLKEEKLNKLDVLAGKTGVINYDLPKFNNEPGVYVGKMEIFDNGELMRTSPVEFRYIIGGDIATIKGLTIDKNSVSKDEDIKLSLSYTGNTFDIQATSTDIKAAIYALNIKMFSEKNELVADLNDNFDFNSGLIKDFSVKSLVAAKSLRAEVVVKNGNKILSEYKINFPTTIQKNEPISVLNYLKLFSLLLTVLFMIGTIILAIRKRIRFAVVAFVLAFLFLLVFFAFKTDALTISYTKNDQWAHFTSLTGSSPSGNYYPNQSFYFTGAAQAVSCDNEPQTIDFYISTDGTNYGGANRYIGTNYGGSCTNHCGDERYYQWAFGPYYAPSTLGSKNIYLKAIIQQGIDRNYSWYGEWRGYQGYTVVARPIPAVPVLTAITGACGGKVNLSWNNATDATSYNLYRNNVLLTSTTSLSFTDIGLATSTNYQYSIKGVSDYGSSATSSPVAVTSSADCAPIVAPPTPVIIYTGGGSSGGVYMSGQPGYCGGKTSLYWDAVPGAVKYRIYESNGTTEVASTSSTYVTIVSAVASSHGYKMKSQNVDGALSSVFSTTTPMNITSSGSCPAPVTSISATALCGGRIDLSWTYDSQTYRLDRAQCIQNVSDGDANCPSWNSWVQVNPDNDGAWIDTGLPLNKWYKYRLTATSSDGIVSSRESASIKLSNSTTCSTPFTCKIIPPVRSYVNSSTQWTATTSPATNLSTYAKKWTVTDSLTGNISYIYGINTNPLNKIFTTLGLKTLGLSVYNSQYTANCTATSSTVIYSGGIQEQ